MLSVSRDMNRKPWTRLFSGLLIERISRVGLFEVSMSLMPSCLDGRPGKGLLTIG